MGYSGMILKRNQTSMGYSGMGVQDNRTSMGYSGMEISIPIPDNTRVFGYGCERALNPAHNHLS